MYIYIYIYPPAPCGHMAANPICCSSISIQLFKWPSSTDDTYGLDTMGSWVPVCSCWFLWVPMGSYWFLWAPMPGILWDSMRPPWVSTSGILWVPVDSYGFLWIHVCICIYNIGRAVASAAAIKDIDESLGFRYAAPARLVQPDLYSICKASAASPCQLYECIYHKGSFHAFVEHTSSSATCSALLENMCTRHISI